MCVFCDIIEGKIPSSKIYEDDTVVAFLDLSQVTKGHALVVPKTHYDHFLSCDSDTLAHLVTNAAGMNILSNVNEAAGQSVMHFHVHLIPRYDETDAITLVFNESPKQDLDALAAQLRYSE